MEARMTTVGPYIDQNFLATIEQFDSTYSKVGDERYENLFLRTVGETLQLEPKPNSSQRRKWKHQYLLATNAKQLSDLILQKAPSGISKSIWTLSQDEKTKLLKFTATWQFIFQQYQAHQQRGRVGKLLEWLHILSKKEIPQSVTEADEKISTLSTQLKTLEATDEAIALVRKDPHSGFQILCDLEARGNKKAAAYKGICLCEGKGTDCDPKEGERLIKNGAMEGVPEAMYYAAIHFPDFIKEQEMWLQRAADAGHAGAMHLLGLTKCRLNRFPEARELFLQAATVYENEMNAGNPEAMNSLFEIYSWQHFGYKPLTSSDTHWLWRQSQEGNIRAKKELAEIFSHFDDKTEEVRKRVFSLTLEIANAKISPGQTEELNIQMEAMRKVALAFDHGIGTEKDAKEAVTWYRRAAEAGDREAQFTMGDTFEKGDIVEKDLTAAFDMYSKAAAQKHGGALSRLGLMYEKGISTPPDKKRAEELYTEALDSIGKETAMHRYVEALREDIRDNQVRAYRQFLQLIQEYRSEVAKAERTSLSEREYKDILARIATMYVHDRVTPPNVPEACDLLLEAGKNIAIATDADAEQVAAFYKKAYALYEELGKSGDETALQRMREMRVELTKHQNRQLERLGLELQAHEGEKGNIEALLQLARSKEATGEYSSALRLLEQAANIKIPQTNAEAQKIQIQCFLSLAQMYWPGKPGVPPNIRKAIEWYKKAEALGEQEATSALFSIHTPEKYKNNLLSEADAVWLKERATEGSILALKTIADLYGNGWGVRKVPALQKRYLQTISEAKISEDRKNDLEIQKRSMKELADLYKNGTDGGKDPQKAVELYSKLASAGDIDSAYILGTMYETGVGVQKDPAIAASMYEIAAAKGHIEASMHLARMLEKGEGVSQSTLSKIKGLYEQLKSQLKEGTGRKKYYEALIDQIDGKSAEALQKFRELAKEYEEKRRLESQPEHVKHLKQNLDRMTHLQTMDLIQAEYTDIKARIKALTQ